MSKQVEWQMVEPGHYRLSGELERDTVPAFWQQREQWMPQDRQARLDLSALTRVDSAGMVMLLHLYEQARSSGCQLTFSQIPEQLKTLLRLSHVESILAASCE